MIWKNDLTGTRVLFLCAALCCFLSQGCAERERYTYERIKASYRPPQTAGAAEETAPTPSPQVPKTPLALDQAILVALQDHPDIEMALARIRQAHAMIDEATASFWPMISAYGEYLQGNAPSSYLFKTIDQRMLPPNVDFNLDESALWRSKPESTSSMEGGICSEGEWQKPAFKFTSSTAGALKTPWWSR